MIVLEKSAEINAKSKFLPIESNYKVSIKKLTHIETILWESAMYSTYHKRFQVQITSDRGGNFSADGAKGF